MKKYFLFLITCFEFSNVQAATTIYCENSSSEKLYFYMDDTSLQMNFTDRRSASEIAKKLPEKRHQFPMPQSVSLVAKIEHCMKLNNQMKCEISNEDYWEVFNSIGKLSARGVGLPAMIEFNQSTSVFRLSTQNLNREIQFKNTCRLSLGE